MARTTHPVLTKLLSVLMLVGMLLTPLGLADPAPVMAQERAVPTSGALSACTGDDKTETTPTAWWYYYGKTTAEVAQLVAANQARIVDIEVEQATPAYRFSVVMVKNQSCYARTWWWYYGLTASELSAKLTANSPARIVDLEAYEVSGQVRFTAVLISNAAPANKAWWWYFNTTTASITYRLGLHNARLIDIETYLIGGQRYYSAVMIRNAGADLKSSGWYLNHTPAQISALLSATPQKRLIDIDRYSTGSFNVITMNCPCPSWWWYHGITANQLSTILAAAPAKRIIDIETYTVGTERRFAVILLRNG